MLTIFFKNKNTLDAQHQHKMLPVEHALWSKFFKHAATARPWRLKPIGKDIDRNFYTMKSLKLNIE